MSNWNTFKLGELTTWKSGGTPPKLDQKYWGGSVPWISAKNLTSYALSTSDVFITQAGLEKGSRLAEVDSILLLVRGSGLFNDIPVGIVTKPVAFNQDVKAIEVDKSKLDPWYLLYWIKGNKALLNTKLEATGIGAGKFDINILRELEINLPPLSIQRKVADFARCWDDKIELNRRMNQTLEQMAQTLFRQYFVDGIDEENLPEGWRWGKIIDLFELQRGFDLPATKRISGSVPVFAAGGLNGFHNEAMVKGPGITTGRSGVIGNVFYIPEDFWPLNTSLFIKKYNASTPLHAFYVLKFTDLKSLNSGSAVPTLNRNEVHTLEVLVPVKEAILEFEEEAKLLFQKIRHNEKEITTLTQLRDTLLPKLMSGEIDVMQIKLEELHEPVFS